MEIARLLPPVAKRTWCGLCRSAMALALLAAPAAVAAAAGDDRCRTTAFEGADYSVCSYAVADTDIRVFQSDAAGRPYGDFDALKAALAAEGRTLAFAMNAGMYQVDRSPVGLCVSAGKQRRGLNRASARGNFYLKPNGVFWIDAAGAHIATTDAYARLKARPREATQSGPMLVIAGRLHPRFSATSPSRLLRNGVGLSSDRKQVHFVMADSGVNLHEFARFFRDGLQTPNALYLDGNISRLYAPPLKRDDFGPRMGPILAVAE